jgi:ubiquinone/menaquinone biosynthesis C-methylase UbiE
MVNLRICPSWLASTLDNPVRRLIHNPEKILSEYIESGQKVLDVGCGPGTFTIIMAKMVGDSGKVIAVDVQDKMLQIVRTKAIQGGARIPHNHP